MGVTYRPYQREAIDRTITTLMDKRSVLLEAATGTGKTAIMAGVINDWTDISRGRALVFVHQRELVEQAAAELSAFCPGKTVGVEMGTEKIRETQRPDIVVATQQTLGQSSRLTKFNPLDFSIVMRDEAHRARAKTDRGIRDYFLSRNPKCRYFGVTATAREKDGRITSRVFEAVSYSYPITRGIDEGYLVPVHQRTVHVDGLDFSRIRTFRGDLDQEELEKILIQEKPLHEVAKATCDIIGTTSAIVFCVSVKHAELLAMAFERYRPGSAYALSGETDPTRRRTTVEEYKRGRVQILCLCSLFLEGFNAPITGAVVMATPTESLVKFTQAVGRGTRTYPADLPDRHPDSADARKRAIAKSAKPSMLLLDFRGNAGKHVIITGADILGFEAHPDAVRIASSYIGTTAKPGGGGMTHDLGDTLHTAELWRQMLSAEEAARRRNITADVASYRTEEVSLFGDDAGQAIKAKREPVAKGKPATDKQVEVLVRYCGWNEAKARRLTVRQASGIISDTFEGKRKKESGK